MIADAGATSVPSSTPAEATFRALGYRQTLKPAAKGGKANHNGFRFRNEGMRALGRSFRGKAFIGGHDWGDPRARGGTIVDAWAEEIENDTEMGVLYDIVAKAAWAIEGLANGTIDRFSFGVIPSGEITCTVHNVPVWSTDECFCWPGGEVDGVISEWEFEDGEGVELSAVNVPAVDGTGIVEPIAADAYREIAANAHQDMLQASRGFDYGDLAALCGRANPRLVKAFERRSVGGAPVGGFTREPPQPTITEKANERGDQMDRALICKSLGLAVTATDEEILAKLTANSTAAAQADVFRTQLEQSATELTASREAELTAHVEGEITRLKASKVVTDAVVDSLRATAAKPNGSRAAFDSALKLVEAAAPNAAPAAGAIRAGLQSEQKPADNPGVPSAGEDGPDSYEQNRANPNLGKFMKLARVTVDDVRKHGARSFTILPNLRELADQTAARGA